MRVEPERLEDCYRELDVLVDGQFSQRLVNDGLPPMRVDWLTLQRLENAGAVELVTARDDEQGGKVVGFVLYLVVPHFHHIGTTVAACDILTVAGSARGRGVGRRLMEVAEPILRARGVSHVTHLFCIYYDTEPLFPKLGYKLIEQSYMKELK